MKKRENIPDIYEYCDRWCERCPFTTRCAVAKNGNSLVSEDGNQLNEKLWQQLSNNTQHLSDLVHQVAIQRGINIDNLLEVSSTLPPSQLQDVIGEIELLCKKYYTDVSTWFKKNQLFIADWYKKAIEHAQLDTGLVSEKELQNLSEVFEVIQWYQHFIGAKTHRAFQGLTEFDAEYEELIQNDMNGSAKIALIAIERSLASWEIVCLRMSEKRDELLDFFIYLSKIRSAILQTFPTAPQFVRPGFDKLDKKIPPRIKV